VELYTVRGFMHKLES